MGDDIRLCGVPDNLGAGSVCKWPQKRVTWCVTGRLPGISDDALVAAYREAWSYWSAVCGIEPVYTEVAAEANVLMGSGSIDGSSGTLAWSEMPCGGSRRLMQKYDSGEHWTVSETPQGKIDLVRVAAHEIGHVIGLPHFAGGTGNLLDPTYSTRVRRPQAGDIAEARRRYGPPKVTPQPTPTPQPGGNVDRNKVLETVLFVLRMAQQAAKLTSNEADDKIIAGLIELLDLLKGSPSQAQLAAIMEKLSA